MKQLFILLLSFAACKEKKPIDRITSDGPPTGSLYEKKLLFEDSPGVWVWGDSARLKISETSYDTEIWDTVTGWRMFKLHPPNKVTIDSSGKILFWNVAPEHDRDTPAKVRISSQGVYINGKKQQYSKNLLIEKADEVIIGEHYK